MKTLTALAFVALLVAKNADAQLHLPKCPSRSNVSSELAKLEMDIILNLAQLSEEWRKKLTAAEYADSKACHTVSMAMYDLAEENMRLQTELDGLRRQNKNLKSRIEK